MIGALTFAAALIVLAIVLRTAEPVGFAIIIFVVAGSAAWVSNKWELWFG